jgi:two-component system sensor histidine kinase YesM
MKLDVPQRSSLLWKIIIIYIILTGIPVIVIFSIASSYWWESSEETSIQHSEKMLQYSRELISNQLDQMENLSTWIYFDPELVAKINENTKLSNENKIPEIRSSFERLFNIMALLRPDVYNYYYFNLEGKLIYVYNNGLWIDYSPRIDYNPVAEPWFTSTKDAEGKTVLISQSLPLHKKDQPIFSMARLIKLSTEPIGVVLIDFNFNVLKDILGKSSEDENSSLLVSDLQGNLVYSTGLLDRETDKVLPSQIWKPAESGFNGSHKIRWKDKEYLLVYETLNKYDLKLIHLLPVANLISEKMAFMLKLSLILLVSMLSMMLVSMYFLYNRIKPLKLLARMMKMTDEDRFLMRFPVTSRDEIGVLGDSFNSMMARIHELIQKDFINKIHLVETEKALLEAQINPHFLYNTLDTIRFKAIERGDIDVSEMLLALSTNLRYTLSSTSQMVHIHDEVEWLERYIYLQKLRFQERFEVFFEIDITIYDIYIYRLILQPFVENAIIHGFKHTEADGILHINGYLQDNRFLIFEIVDNGCGFPVETDTTIRYDSFRSLNRGRIGIYNAVSRLFLYYEERCEIEITSIPDKRTAIRIKIDLGGHGYENPAD